MLKKQWMQRNQRCPHLFPLVPATASGGAMFAAVRKNVAPRPFLGLKVDHRLCYELQYTTIAYFPLMRLHPDSNAPTASIASHLTRLWPDTAG
jgi:hypothetical protein